MLRRVAFSKAVLAGAAGAFAWEIVARLLIWSGVPLFDLVRILGTMYLKSDAPAWQWWSAGILAHACVGAIWRQARELPRNLSGNILPLVVDVSRPPPALGWRNRECASFLGRAAGTFDCVMLLAVIHHLLINERVPLDEILGLAAELTSEFLAIEFIAPEDEMFRELARGREDLHIELTQAAFEAACGEHFEIVRSLALPGTQRRLYWLRKKGVRSPGPGVGREAAGRTNGR